jgi:hypothetical protein
VFRAVVEVVTAAKREGNNQRLAAFGWFIHGMMQVT